MNMTWDGAPPPDHVVRGKMAVLRVLWRGIGIMLIIFVGLALLLPVRLIERPFFGLARPWTPWITQVVCRLSLFWLGLSYVRTGKPMKGRGAIVANHSSWLDIFVLNAADRIYFVSKSEVAGWPGIGTLARATGTLFIARDPRAARIQTELFQERLLAGQRLLFFPEGTSTDGLRVLPFKTTLFASLFASFFAEDLHPHLYVQPVTVVYHAPQGRDLRTYGWWGDMGFGTHLLATLALPRQGRVEVIYHPPLAVSDFADRKALAAAAEIAVLNSHEPATSQRKVNDGA
ncbi:1-acyl-sn-glycerol-3-phosphate acyltransferase [uncultured Tateyamaria sp.]|uniref:lysophospholipid acyltransferase family protein n=1 Tax=uncultured Tateyamaria sp. TaxID=455651 RepID=UPI00260690D5|nr:lysophospholipid acyltransferase family protein [uncultured Tateyamaria sp.]